MEKSDPPVCRIMDNGKFQYQKSKQEKDQGEQPEMMKFEKKQPGERRDENLNAKTNTNNNPNTNNENNNICPFTTTTTPAPAATAA
ncbi:MAG: hypothetical protein ABGZ35_21575, partial [Planctomycetaceae bacterium]